MRTVLKLLESEGVAVEEGRTILIHVNIHLSMLQLCHNSETFNLFFSLYVRSPSAPGLKRLLTKPVRPLDIQEVCFLHKTDLQVYGSPGWFTYLRQSQTSGYIIY